MNIFSWLTGSFSARGKALAVYRRGMEKMKRGDMEGAIADYTVVADQAATPEDVKAMALFNRGLAHHKAKNQEQAAVDFQAVLEMDQAPPNIKAATREKLARWDVRDQRRTAKAS